MVTFKLLLLLLQALTGDCGFLAANLYARSIFGEDALANLSIEKVVESDEKTSVQGHVRIRAKTQVERESDYCVSLPVLGLIQREGDMDVMRYAFPKKMTSKPRLLEVCI